MTSESTRRTLRAECVVDLAPDLAGCADPIAFGVDGEGAIYAVGRRSDETPYAGNFPKSTLDVPADHVLVRWREGTIDRAVVSGVDVPLDYVQPHPKGALLAGARCRWRAEGAEHNAVVVDWSGRVVDRFTLGDGIADVRVTPDGTIWVSYFDEGVFGNFGWGHPGPAPMGACGLVAFDAGGRVLRAYDAAVAGTDSICDVYALNVRGDDDVWLYFYTEFSIVHWRSAGLGVWECGIGGARAIAVREPRVLLFGDYKQASTARVLELHDGRAEIAGTARVVDDRGASLDAALVRSVGSDLYTMRERRVSVVREW